MVDRFERIFGQIGDKSKIDAALEELHHDDLREFIEEHYQAAIK